MTGFKICGITNEVDLELALSVQPNMVGFVLAESPRKVSLEKADELMKKVAGRAKTVIVTTSESPDKINMIADALKPDYIQIHSETEGIETINWKKIGVVKVEGDVEVLKKRTEYLTNLCEYVLFDTGAGTGTTHDWGKTSMLREIALEKTMLAGGLNPGNVREAIEAVRPFMVDVSSGVEASPGKKDPEKIIRFAEEVRGTYGV